LLPAINSWGTLGKLTVKKGVKSSVFLQNDAAIYQTMASITTFFMPVLAAGEAY